MKDNMTANKNVKKRIQIETVNDPATVRAMMTIVAGIQAKTREPEAKVVPISNHKFDRFDHQDSQQQGTMGTKGIAYRDFFHALTCALWEPSDETNIEDLGIDMERASRKIAALPELARRWSETLGPLDELEIVLVEGAGAGAAIQRLERWTGLKFKILNPQTQTFYG
jgi:hypothetical protein